MTLLRRPFGESGKVHDICPVDANWKYIGFSLHRLGIGDMVEEDAGNREANLVLVEGKAQIGIAGEDFGVLCDRIDVFEKTPPH